VQLVAVLLASSVEAFRGAAVVEPPHNYFLFTPDRIDPSNGSGRSGSSGSDRGRAGRPRRVA
jgi:hypothetical protein